jgi:urate oxidase
MLYKIFQSLQVFYTNLVKSLASPERFALHLGTHLVSRYAHIHKAFITIELRWSRIPVYNTGAMQVYADDDSASVQVDFNRFPTAWFRFTLILL